MKVDVPQEDYIGLKQLDLSGRLELKSLPGYHMHFSLKEFDDQVIRPYLDSNTSRPIVAK